MGLSELLAVIGIIVGLIGVIVGLVGIYSLSITNKGKIRNRDVNNSSIQQGTIINNGLDSYAVIKLTKDITKEELESVIKKLNKQDNEIESIKDTVSKQPRFHVGTEEPKDAKDGDIWFEID